MAPIEWNSVNFTVSSVATEAAQGIVCRIVTSQSDSCPSVTPSSSNKCSGAFSGNVRPVSLSINISFGGYSSIVKSFSSMASGSSINLPYPSIARHSALSIRVVIFSRCISAFPKVAVIRAMNSPAWFKRKASFFHLNGNPARSVVSPSTVTIQI